MPDVITADQLSNQALPPVNLPEIPRSIPHITVTPSGNPPPDNPKGGNWWDSFPDAPSSATSSQVAAPPSSNAAPQGGNWWDSFPDAPSTQTNNPQEQPQEQPDVLRDVIKSTAQAVPYAMTGILGGPFDIGTSLGQAGVNAVGKMIWGNNFPVGDEMPHATTEIPNKLERAIGITPYEPQTFPGRVANTATQFLGGSAYGVGPLEALTSGVLSEGAGELTKGTKLEPWARLGGAFIPGVAGMGGGAIANQVGKILQPATLGKGTQNISGIRATNNQMALAGQRIMQAAKNPEEVKNALGLGSDTVPPQPTIPGDQSAGIAFKPTLAGVTGDTGVSAWQRNLSRGRQEFQDRQHANQRAANEAINRQASGNPADVGAFFAKQLSEKEDQASQISKLSQDNVTTQREAVGGTETPSAYGESIRGQIQSGKAAAKAKESELWKAVSKYFKVPVKRNLILDAVNNARADVNKMAAESLHPEEEKLYDSISQTWGNIKNPTTFGDLKELRTTVYQARKAIERNLDSTAAKQAARRLNSLEEALFKTLDDTVSGIAAMEQKGVESGHVDPADTLSAKILKEEGEKFHERGAEAHAVGEPPSRGAANENATVPSKAVPSEGGPKSEAGSGSNPPKSGAGPTPIKPTKFDAAGRDAYAKARAATQTNKRIYDRGIIKNLLETHPGDKASFKVYDSAVADKLWKSVKENPESFEQYLAASGDKAKAQEVLEQAAAADMSKAAVSPSGEVNAKALQSWLKKNDNILGYMPELKDKLSSLQKAQEFYEQVSAQAADNLKKFQKSRAMSFINKEPDKAVSDIMASKNPTEEMRTVYDAVKGDPDALMGLKRGLVEHILKNVRGVLEEDTKGLDVKTPLKLERFLEEKREAIKIVLGGQGYQSLKAVASAMRKEREAFSGTVQKGESPTAHLMAMGERAKEPSSLYGHIKEEIKDKLGEIGAAAGHFTPLGLFGGAVIGFGAKILMGMNASGLKTVEALETEAALHPELARLLVQKATKITPRLEKNIATELVKKLVPFSNVSFEHRK